MVIEAKWSDKDASLEKECDDALNQIQEKQYLRNLELEGFTDILCYGAAFRGKNVSDK